MLHEWLKDSYIRPMFVFQRSSSDLQNVTHWNGFPHHRWSLIQGETRAAGQVCRLHEWLKHFYIWHTFVFQSS